VSFLRLLTFLAWLGWGAGVAAATPVPPLAAAHASANAAVVEGFDLEQVVALVPGVALNFSVYGSSQAAVTLYIEGASHLVDLAETQSGIYEGAYVIGGRDRIRADSRVIATLQRRGEVVRSTLAEPLLLERGTVPWAEPAQRAAAVAPLTATAPPSDAPVRAPVVRVGVPVPLAQPVAAAAPARPNCGDCAIVESVRVDTAPAHSGGLGAVAGAIAGAVVGNQLAEAHRRHVMQALGAITGALLGREIEVHQAAAPGYNVVLRLPDGSALERRYEQPPPFKPGDTIRLSGNGVRAVTF
jgi:outer membrane lipoprotein SlyB